MAIRSLKTYESKCDKCGKIISKFRAFSNGKEDEILSNLVCLCIGECEVKNNGADS